MKHLLTALLLGILSLSSFSQKNFIPGTITKLNGEIINGFIDDKGWLISPEEIEFKSDIDSEIIKYKPEEIRSFKTDKSYYISKNIDILDAETKLERLPHSAEANFINKTIFLNVLVDSKISLLYYKDDKSKDHFFIMQDNKVDELIHYKYIKEKEGYDKGIVTENKKYIGQLKYILNECSSKTLNTNISYSANSLKKLIIAYNQCLGADYYVSKREKAKLNFAIKIGAISNNCSFSAEAENTALEQNMNNVSYDNSITPTASLTVDLVIPYWNNRFNAFLDLNYRYFEMEGKSIYKGFIGETNFTNKLDASLIGTILGLRYVYNLNKVNLTLGIGMSNSFVIDLSSNTFEERTTFTTYVSDEYETFDDYKRYSAGIAIEPGIEFSKFILQYRYLRDNSISNYSGVNSTYTSNSILIGFKF